MDRREFPEGTIVFKEGDPGGKLFMLVSGAVEISVNSQIVATVSEGGAMFGETSLLLKSPHSATMRTMKPSEFLVIHDVDKLVESQPALFVRMATQLAIRLKEMDERFVELRKNVVDQLETLLNGLENGLPVT